MNNDEQGFEAMAKELATVVCIDCDGPASDYPEGENPCTCCKVLSNSEKEVKKTLAKYRATKRSLPGTYEEAIELYNNNAVFQRIVDVSAHMISATKRERFPVSSVLGNPAPTSCSWEAAGIAYSQYSARFGKDQSLERLAERGGFSANEMDEYYPGWREHTKRDEGGLVREINNYLDHRIKCSAVIKKDELRHIRRQIKEILSRYEKGGK